MMLTQTQDLTQEDERDKINTPHTLAHTLQQRERERAIYTITTNCSESLVRPMTHYLMINPQDALEYAYDAVQ